MPSFGTIGLMESGTYGKLGKSWAGLNENAPLVGHHLTGSDQARLTGHDHYVGGNKMML